MKYLSTFEGLESLPKKIDYFLMCASYEDRTLTFYDQIEDSRINKFKLFYFKEFLKYTEINIKKYENKFNISKYILSISSPISIADSLVECFSDLERKSNVVVDISTFTRESILIILKYLSLNSDKFSEIYFFYRCANVSSDLSSIVRQIRSVLGYMGELEEYKPLHLVLLSGFEISRAKEIIDTIEPDYISIGFGDKDKSISTGLFEINKDFTEKIISYYRNEEVLNIFNHSLIDIYEVKKTILNLVDKNPSHNFVVVPLSNKLSTVGAGLAALENSKIQLCYSEVENYNIDNYSQIMDECFVELLNFNS
ncbi:hypothetical protein [Acinetobacter baumannii]|uniref:hypothetical protein n=1 Tax=Acinetobacter baumannii TaxID=470 RepID=UPI00101F12EE|nr:hypothetical protein [Acinetobacter baumannii]RYL17100.1 hypothetical protein EWO92_11385 [Acinetobacter baumannii]RYL30529.1 hypothetical protein EWO96_10305 [Acinetobacter baumannii]RYL44464.1 hypothetical protein EWP49_11380 [Acinetobacter baumannii]